MPTTISGKICFLNGQVTDFTMNAKLINYGGCVFKKACPLCYFYAV